MKTERSNQPGRLIALVTVTCLALVAGSCSGGSEERTEIDVWEYSTYFYSFDDPNEYQDSKQYDDRILLYVSRCGGGGFEAEVVEDASSIEISVTASDTGDEAGNGCQQDTVEVPIAAPVGDRVIYDAKTGMQVQLSPGDPSWNDGHNG